MVRVRYSFSCRRTGRIAKIDKQREKFPSLMKKVIRTSDVLLEILDARFIEETRNHEIEAKIEKEGKKIIYVLNKSDLVNKKKKIAEVKKLGLFPYVFISCKERRGIRDLRDKIKIFSKKFSRRGPIVKTNKFPKHSKVPARLQKINAAKAAELERLKRAQVGIIGYPNTGKSSLVNLLSGKFSAKIGAEPGFTKGIQKIRLSSEILLLDTPGVIPEREYSHTNPAAIKKQIIVGARAYGKLRDPEIAVLGLMEKYPKEIEKYYGIDADGNFEVLIEELGRKRNFLKKGGKIETNRAIDVILKDWQEGKIKI